MAEGLGSLVSLDCSSFVRFESRKRLDWGGRAMRRGQEAMPRLMRRFMRCGGGAAVEPGLVDYVITRIWSEGSGASSVSHLRTFLTRPGQRSIPVVLSKPVFENGFGPGGYWSFRNALEASPTVVCPRSRMLRDGTADGSTRLTLPSKSGSAAEVACGFPQSRG